MNYRYNLHTLLRALGVVLLLSLALSPLAVRAQDEPQAEATPKFKLLKRDTSVKYIITPSKPHKMGWFGAPMLEVGKFFDQTAAFVGGGVALVIDRHFYVGVYAQNLASDVRDTVPTPSGPSINSVHFLHGGLWLGYNLLYAKVVHLTASLKLGGGRLTERPTGPNGLGQPVLEDDVFLITPHLGVNINVTPFLQISLEAGYRFGSGLDVASVPRGSIDGALGLLGFRFGRF